MASPNAGEPRHHVYGALLCRSNALASLFAVSAGAGQQAHLLYSVALGATAATLLVFLHLTIILPWKEVRLFQKRLLPLAALVGAVVAPLLLDGLHDADATAACHAAIDGFMHLVGSFGSGLDASCAAAAAAGAVGGLEAAACAAGGALGWHASELPVALASALAAAAVAAGLWVVVSSHQAARAAQAAGQEGGLWTALFGRAGRKGIAGLTPRQAATGALGAVAAAGLAYSSDPDFSILAAVGSVCTQAARLVFRAELTVLAAPAALVSETASRLASSGESWEGPMAWLAAVATLALTMRAYAHLASALAKHGAGAALAAAQHSVALLALQAATGWPALSLPMAAAAWILRSSLPLAAPKAAARVAGAVLTGAAGAGEGEGGDNGLVPTATGGLLYAPGVVSAELAATGGKPQRGLLSRLQKRVVPASEGACRGLILLCGVSVTAFLAGAPLALRQQATRSGLAVADTLEQLLGVSNGSSATLLFPEPRPRWQWCASGGGGNGKSPCVLGDTPLPLEPRTETSPSSTATTFSVDARFWGTRCVPLPSVPGPEAPLTAAGARLLAAMLPPPAADASTLSTAYAHLRAGLFAAATPLLGAADAAASAARDLGTALLGLEGVEATSGASAAVLSSMPEAAASKGSVGPSLHAPAATVVLLALRIVALAVTAGLTVKIVLPLVVSAAALKALLATAGLSSAAAATLAGSQWAWPSVASSLLAPASASAAASVTVPAGALGAAASAALLPPALVSGLVLPVAQGVAATLGAYLLFHGGPRKGLFHGHTLLGSRRAGARGGRSSTPGLCMQGLGVAAALLVGLVLFLAPLLGTLLTFPAGTMMSQLLGDVSAEAAGAAAALGSVLASVPGVDALRASSVWASLPALPFNGAAAAAAVPLVLLLAAAAATVVLPRHKMGAVARGALAWGSSVVGAALLLAAFTLPTKGAGASAMQPIAVTLPAAVVDGSAAPAAAAEAASRTVLVACAPISLPLPPSPLHPLVEGIILFTAVLTSSLLKALSYDEEEEARHNAAAAAAAAATAALAAAAGGQGGEEDEVTAVQSSRGRGGRARSGGANARAAQYAVQRVPSSLSGDAGERDASPAASSSSVRALIYRTLPVGEGEAEEAAPAAATASTEASGSWAGSEFTMRSNSGAGAVPAAEAAAAAALGPEFAYLYGGAPAPGSGHGAAGHVSAVAAVLGEFSGLSSAASSSSTQGAGRAAGAGRASLGSSSSGPRFGVTGVSSLPAAARQGGYTQASRAAPAPAPVARVPLEASYIDEAELDAALFGPGSSFAAAATRAGRTSGASFAAYTPPAPAPAPVPTRTTAFADTGARGVKRPRDLAAEEEALAAAAAAQRREEEEEEEDDGGLPQHDDDEDEEQLPPTRPAAPARTFGVGSSSAAPSRAPAVTFGGASSSSSSSGAGAGGLRYRGPLSPQGAAAVAPRRTFSVSNAAPGSGARGAGGGLASPVPAAAPAAAAAPAPVAGGLGSPYGSSYDAAVLEILRQARSMKKARTGY